MTRFVLSLATIVIASLVLTGKAVAQSVPIDTTFYYRLTTLWQGKGKSLGVINDGTNNMLQLEASDNVTGQYWKFTPLGDGYYRLTTAWLGGSKSLDVVNDGASNRDVQMAATDDVVGQHWKITSVGGGYVRLTTEWRGNGLSLDIVNDAAKNRPRLAPTGNASGQRWLLTKVEPIR